MIVCRSIKFSYQQLGGECLVSLSILLIERYYAFVYKTLNHSQDILICLICDRLSPENR